MTNKTLTLDRLIEAPVESVFPLWIEAEHLAKWFAPKNFTVPFCKVDARVGGEIRLDMQGPDGTRYPMRSVFIELVPNERIVTRNQAMICDSEASLEVINTITFTAEAGKTRLTVHAEVLRVDPGMELSVAGMEEGWKQTLDKLEEIAAQV
jgi:uncharacterized protein YndB with AHSA1/START domain